MTEESRSCQGCRLPFVAYRSAETAIKGRLSDGETEEAEGAPAPLLLTPTADAKDLRKWPCWLVLFGMHLGRMQSGDTLLDLYWQPRLAHCLDERFGERCNCPDCCALPAAAEVRL